MERRITVSDIRSVYSKPISIFDADQRLGYCVGGALFRYVGLPDRFPTPRQMAEVLSDVNPALTEKPAAALWFAQTIAQFNDRGEFEEAWKWLDRALTFGDRNTWSLIAYEGLASEQDSETAGSAG